MSDPRDGQRSSYCSTMIDTRVLLQPDGNSIPETGWRMYCRAAMTTKRRRVNYIAILVPFPAIRWSGRLGRHRSRVQAEILSYGRSVPNPRGEPRRDIR